MPRKVVKVYLSSTQSRLLKNICQQLGVNESSFFNNLFSRYLADMNVVKEALHGRS